MNARAHRARLHLRARRSPRRVHPIIRRLLSIGLTTDFARREFVVVLVPSITGPRPEAYAPYTRTRERALIAQGAKYAVLSGRRVAGFAFAPLPWVTPADLHALADNQLVQRP